MSPTPKIDASAALAMWNGGATRKQIADALCPGASNMSVVRAIRRAVAAGGVRLPARGQQLGNANKEGE